MTNEITPNKAMSPKEYAMTQDYKERAYSYNYRRCIDDLKNNPIEFMGNVYCSSNKLGRKLEREFGKIKRLISRNIWQFEGFTGKVELGVYYPDNKSVESVWLRVGKLKLAVWVKDKADLRKMPDDSLLIFFLGEWKACTQKI